MCIFVFIICLYSLPYSLRQNITVIGRAKRNVDFFIASSKHKVLISRIHARISKSQTQPGNVFKIYDVSLNGTFVNDIKISSEALLKPGDVITFGHVQGAMLQTGNCYKQLNSEFRFLVITIFYGELMIMIVTKNCVLVGKNCLHLIICLARINMGIYCLIV